MLVFGTEAAVGIWNAIEQKVLTKSKVVPLPSWWHLPSEAVTMALALLFSFSRNSLVEIPAWF